MSKHRAAAGGPCSELDKGGPKEGGSQRIDRLQRYAGSRDGRKRRDLPPGREGLALHQLGLVALRAGPAVHLVVPEHNHTVVNYYDICCATLCMNTIAFNILQYTVIQYNYYNII